MYSDTCLDRPLPWEATCLERPHIPSRRSYISVQLQVSTDHLSWQTIIFLWPMDQSFKKGATISWAWSSDRQIYPENSMQDFTYFNRCRCHKHSMQDRAYYVLFLHIGPCILRPPIQTERCDLNVKVQWRDNYSENITAVSLTSSLKMWGIVKWWGS